MPRLGVAACALFGALTFAAPAFAQDAPPITKNDYRLELYQGPLLAPIRITGLAGATTAVSESVEGVYNNAAAPSVRETTSLRWFEWDLSASISFPGAFGGTDFNNRGEKGLEKQRERAQAAGANQAPTVETTDRFLYLQGGLWGQFGALGVAATADLIRYDLAGAADTNASLRLSLARFHFVGAYSFLKNQLNIGAGIRAVYVDLATLEQSGSSVIGMFGIAPQVGAIYKPTDAPFRIGATVRAPVEAGPFSIGNLFQEERTDGTSVRRAGGSFVVPDRITQPWEVEAGIAYQLGPRPLNPEWLDPNVHARELERATAQKRVERQALARAELAAMPTATDEDRADKAQRAQEISREEQALRALEDQERYDAEQRLYDERKARLLNWPREHVLLLASVLMTGASRQAVALEGFIDQRRELVGQTLSIAPRFAVETEAVPNLIKFRAGVYFEPSRFEDGSHRQHFTMGGDLKLVEWDLFGIIPEQWFRLNAFLDLAQRYQNFGFGIGTWH